MAFKVIVTKGNARVLAGGLRVGIPTGEVWAHVCYEAQARWHVEALKAFVGVEAQIVRVEQ